MSIEKSVLHPAQHFEFSLLERHPTQIVAEGHYLDTRKCKLVGGRFVAYDYENNFHTLVSRQIELTTTNYIPEERTEIGTWVIDYPPELYYDTIKMIVLFKCHPFWVLEIEIAIFKAPNPIFDKDGVIDFDQMNTNLLESTQNDIPTSNS